MYSLKHILILCVCVVYIVLALCFLLKKKPPLSKVVKWLLAIGIISETLKVCTYIVINEEKFGGYLPKTDLPFHLCSMQIILMVILVIAKNEKLKKTLYAFMFPSCLVGGVAALLLPTYSSLNNPVIMVQYFLYHSSIAVFAVYLAANDEIKFEFRDYLKTLGLLYAFFFAAIYLNSWINDYQNNINFMYVVNPPVEGLPFLNKDHGWLVYIIHYAVTALLVVTLCYIKPIVSKIKSLRKTEKECA